MRALPFPRFRGLLPRSGGDGARYRSRNVPAPDDAQGLDDPRLTGGKLQVPLRLPAGDARARLEALAPGDEHVAKKRIPVVPVRDDDARGLVEQQQAVLAVDPPHAIL